MLRIGPLLGGCATGWTIGIWALGLVLPLSPGRAQTPQQALQHYKNAIRFLEAGDVGGAETEIERALIILPSQPEILNLAGTIALRQRRIDKAIEYLEATLRQRPDYAHPRLNLGLAYLEVKQPEKAIPVLRWIVDRNQEDFAAHLGLARALYQTGGYEESLKPALRAVELAPNNPEALYFLARSQLRSGQAKEGTASATKAAGLVSGDPARLHSLGLLLLENRRYDEAIPFLRQAAEGQDPGILQSLGRGYGLLQRLNHAAEALRRSIQLAPDSPGGYVLLSICYQMQGRFDEAVQELERALELDPEHGQANHNLAVNRFKQGRLEEAGRILEALLLREPNRVESLYYQALVRFQQNDYQRALAPLTRALELDPNHLAAYFKAGQVFLKLGQKETASKYLKRFQELSQERDRSRSARGRVYSVAADTIPSFQVD